MQRRTRPLMLMFVVFVLLCAIRGISLASHLHEYGLRTFSMMTFRNYFHWIIILSFIHLYIRKSFCAWYVLLLGGIYLFGGLTLSEPPQSKDFPGWYFNLAAFILLIFFINYLLRKYKAYRTYTESDGLSDGSVIIKTSYPADDSNNPLFCLFVPSIWMLVLGSFSLFSYFAVSTEEPMPLFTIFFWITTFLFTWLYKTANRHACDVAILGLFSVMIYLIVGFERGDNLAGQLLIAILSWALHLALIGYLLKKRQQYMDYVKDL